MAPQPFPETADIETASDDYAGRFATPVGEWMLRLQAEITLSLLPPSKSSRILDVGGGHAQLAAPLVAAGYHNIDITGSAASCQQRLEGLEHASWSFAVADSTALPYPDATFDTVLCFRLLTHCADWQKVATELCRVTKGTVIIDYPTSQSLNALTPLLFGAKKGIEKNTRTYELFRHRQITDLFTQQGFFRTAKRPQFAWPMVLHRALKNLPLSQGLERVAKAVGLTDLAGSPIIAAFERR